MNVCETIFRRGNIDPIALPNFLRIGIDCLFYLRAGDRKRMPAYLLGFFKDNLKHMAPPKLKPEMNIFLFPWYCDIINSMNF